MKSQTRSRRLVATLLALITLVPSLTFGARPVGAERNYRTVRAIAQIKQVKQIGCWEFTYNELIDYGTPPAQLFTGTSRWGDLLIQNSCTVEKDLIVWVSWQEDLSENPINYSGGSLPLKTIRGTDNIHETKVWVNISSDWTTLAHEDDLYAMDLDGKARFVTNAHVQIVITIDGFPTLWDESDDGLILIDSLRVR